MTGASLPRGSGGEPFPGDNIGGFKLERLVAVQGEHPDCESLSCRRRMLPEGGSVCVGYHCPLCDKPTNSFGHHDCPRAGDVADVASNPEPGGNQEP